MGRCKRDASDIMRRASSRRPSAQKHNAAVSSVNGHSGRMLSAEGRFQGGLVLAREVLRQCQDAIPVEISRIVWVEPQAVLQGIDGGGEISGE